MATDAHQPRLTSGGRRPGVWRAAALAATGTALLAAVGACSGPADTPAPTKPGSTAVLGTTGTAGGGTVPGTAPEGTSPPGSRPPGVSISGRDGAQARTGLLTAGDLPPGSWTSQRVTASTPIDIEPFEQQPACQDVTGTLRRAAGDVTGNARVAWHDPASGATVEHAVTVYGSEATVGAITDAAGAAGYLDCLTAVVRRRIDDLVAADPSLRTTGPFVVRPYQPPFAAADVGLDAVTGLQVTYTLVADGRTTAIEVIDLMGTRGRRSTDLQVTSAGAPLDADALFRVAGARLGAG